MMRIRSMTSGLNENVQNTFRKTFSKQLENQKESTLTQMC